MSLTNKKVYIAATGAGASAQNYIWETPGCSSYFAGATFPYRQDLLEDFIGYKPEKFVSPEVAIDMAMRAYQLAWSDEGDNAVGIGCSAAVATTRLRHGEYGAYVSICSNQGVYLYHVVLDAEVGTQPRVHQGESISSLIASLAKYDYYLSARYPKVDAYDTAKSLLTSRPYWRRDNKRLLEHAFEREIITHATDTSGYVKRPIFPGAFNPPHVGHLDIASKTNSVFNLEVCPPHKDPLSVTEILQRLKMLRYHDVLLTDGLPLYLDKSNRFQNHPIVMGADAFLRMLDPKWGPTPKEILTRFSQNGTRIYVFGREVDGKYISADDAVAVTEEVGVVFDVQPVPGRWDISSSAIRRGPKR